MGLLLVQVTVACLNLLAGMGCRRVLIRKRKAAEISDEAASEPQAHGSGGSLSASAMAEPSQRQQVPVADINGDGMLELEAQPSATPSRCASPAPSTGHAGPRPTPYKPASPAPSTGGAPVDSTPAPAPAAKKPPISTPAAGTTEATGSGAADHGANSGAEEELPAPARPNKRPASTPTRARASGSASDVTNGTAGTRRVGARATRGSPQASSHGPALSARALKILRDHTPFYWDKQKGKHPVNADSHMGQLIRILEAQMAAEGAEREGEGQGEGQGGEDEEAAAGRRASKRPKREPRSPSPEPEASSGYESDPDILSCEVLR